MQPRRIVTGMIGMVRMGIKTGRTTALTRRVCEMVSATGPTTALSSTEDATAMTPPIKLDTTEAMAKCAATDDGAVIGIEPGTDTVTADTAMVAMDTAAITGATMLPSRLAMRTA